MAQQIRGHFALTEDPVYNLTLLPISSLCSMFAIENVIAQLPQHLTSPAISVCCHAMPACHGRCLSFWNNKPK